MDFWEVDKTDGVLVAAYCNPPTNYLVGSATEELNSLICSWRADDTINAIVITGGVKDRFITHYSVEELVELAKNREDLINLAPSLIYGYHNLLRSLAYLDIPIVVGMTGDTMGAGLEMSLNCDIRIAQKGNFVIGFPEVALGILTGTGSQLLARTIGLGKATDFLLRSRIVEPQEALNLGIVTELADDAKERAISVANGLNRQSKVSVIAGKRALVRGSNLPIEEGLRIEAEEWLKTVVTEQAIELMKDYVEQPFEKRRDWIRQYGIPHQN